MASFFSTLKQSKSTNFDVLQYIVKLTEDENWIELTSKKEIQKIATFLCQMEEMSALKVLLVKCFKRIDKIPGDALFYFITKNSNLNIADSVFSILDSEHLFFKTYMCPFNIDKNKYSEQVKKQHSIYLQRFNRTKEDLIDKLQFAQNQHLEAEVKKTLEKLIEAFPNDPSFVKEKGLYFEKEAGNIIDRSNKVYSEKKIKNQAIPNHTLLFNADEVYEAIHTEFNDKNLVYLLEVFLVSGEDEIALRILNKNKILKNIYFWNFVELLIVKQRHLEALAEIKEMKTLKTTEDKFNYYYYTAICLWNLNDKITALDTMKSISKVKPHFKQTQTYLNLWQQYEKVG